MLAFRRGAAFAVDIDNRIFHYRIILLTLMSSVFLLAFLLFQLEQTLFFGFLLFSGSLFAFELVFFILLLQRLLRLCADSRFFKLFMRVSLTAFRVIRLLFDFCFDGWTAHCGMAYLGHRIIGFRGLRPAADAGRPHDHT